MHEFLGLAWMFVLYVIFIPLVFISLFSKITNDDIVNLVGALLISMIAFIIFSVLNMNFREYEFVYDRDIETMIISRHNAEGEMYYYYMVKSGDTYESRKSNQNISTLRYTNEQPRVEVFKKESTNKFVYFFMPVNTYVDDYRYDFYIPDGTIKEEFKVDLN